MGKAAYYNEIDEFAAEWLRKNMEHGLIAEGEVDTRSIEDVQPDDVKSFTQCHFFAGIGTWSYALRLAGWPDDRPVWTGSCPCQPFSAVGKRQGREDARHLWPQFFRLIQECSPAIVFGEQIAGKAGYQWWDIVSADMETRGYACGAANLCAASVGMAHIRQRLYWVGNSHSKRLEGHTWDDGEKERWPFTAGHLAKTGIHDCSYQWRDGWDGQCRPVKPGVQLMVDGFPGRNDLLRCIGNAIVPQVAQAFIETVMEVCE